MKNIIKNKMILSLIVLSAVGCSDSQNNKLNPVLDGIQLITQNQDQSSAQQRLTYEDFPNDKTNPIYRS